MRIATVLLAAVIGFLSTAAFAVNDCTMTVNKSTWTLQGDCTTDASLIVADGITFNLNGYTITPHDPTGGHFVGGVVQSGGARANATNGTIQASGLADMCDAEAARLRGVLFDGASGSI